jgi:cytochrome b561
MRAMPSRYGSVAVLIHWLTALLILALFVLGWTMVQLRPGSASQFQLY